MEYLNLGRSGLEVSRLTLGAMGFGDSGWRSWVLGDSESRAIIRRALDLGINAIDTCDYYSNGQSEEIVGRAIKDFVKRGEIVIATKVGNPMGKGPNNRGFSRKHIFDAVEQSLKRLQVDYIDLYQTHIWDPRTNLEEMMHAFHDLVRSGKVLYIGASDFPAWQVSRANTIAELRGWTPFSALQIEYSLIERTVERELIPMANGLGLTVTPWAPLGAGILSGKYKREADSKTSRGGTLTEERLRIADAVAEVAQMVGCSPAQVALAWLRHQPGSVIPIIGARTVEQIKDNLGSIHVKLTPDHLSKLDEASRVDLGFPMKFLSTDRFRQIVSGGTWAAVDHKRHL